MNKNYIGLASSFHDSSIAVVDSSGELTFAEATERYTQCKRAMNIGPDLLWHSGRILQQYCEPQCETVVGFSWSEKMQNQNLAALKADSVKQRTILRSIYSELPDYLRFRLGMFEYNARSAVYSVQAAGNSLAYEAARSGRCKGDALDTRYFDHHLTHAAAGCFTSAFDDALCVVLDGYGEGSAYACFKYSQGRLSRVENVGRLTPGTINGSLGGFYGDVCIACGFDPLAGEEWKVMGLAAHGELDREIYGVFRELVRVNGLSLESPPPMRQLQLYKRLNAIQRKSTEPVIVAANTAYTGQLVFTELLMEFLGNAFRLGISENLVLAGGCALNSAANGQIVAATGFKRLHVNCAPGDDGNSVGAALLAFQQDNPDFRPSPRHRTPYLGSYMSAATLKSVRQFGGVLDMTPCGGQAPRHAAEALAAGRIIGWIQGRAEFGPRALGNRSILADPRIVDIKDQINARVKFREEYRPLAPSILHEYGHEYFADYHESPYMERALKFKPEAMGRVPGVVHQDGTGRLQTVKEEWNKPYFDLITAFHAVTGIPIVLNTSYNVMGKPIVHTVEDVLAVFLTSGIDMVFIDDWMIDKRAVRA